MPVNLWTLECIMVASVWDLGMRCCGAGNSSQGKGWITVFVFIVVMHARDMLLSRDSFLLHGIHKPGKQSCVTLLVLHPF